MSTPVDPAGLDDIHLSALARDGDPAAIRELWTRHHPAVLAAAHRVASQPRDAEEIASDAFSGMLAALSAGSGPTGSVRAYLLTSVRNGAITRSRQSIATTLTDNDDVFENPAVAPHDPVGWANELGLMREAFATLPRRWQHVLWRTAVDLDSPATVAVELGLKPNTAAALAHRARQGLRRAYVQAHASRGTVDDECAPFIPELATVLGRAGGRSGVAAHVDGCERCTRARCRATPCRPQPPGDPASRRRRGHIDRYRHPGHIQWRRNHQQRRHLDTGPGTGCRTRRCGCHRHVGLGAVARTSANTRSRCGDPERWADTGDQHHDAAKDAHHQCLDDHDSRSVSRSRGGAASQVCGTQPLIHRDPRSSTGVEPDLDKLAVPSPTQVSRLSVALAMGGPKSAPFIMISASGHDIESGVGLRLTVPTGVPLTSSGGDWSQCSRDGNTITCRAVPASSQQWSGSVSVTGPPESAGTTIADLTGTSSVGARVHAQTTTAWASDHPM